MNRAATKMRGGRLGGSVGSVERAATPPLQESLLKNVYVVIPAFNESASIGEVVTEVRDSYPNAVVVVVDDGSSDGTGEIALRAGATRLRHVVNRGQGAALQSGIEYGLAQGAEVLVTFDADGQHAVEDIGRMIAPILAGDVDVTLGSRFLGTHNDVPAARRLLLLGGILFTRITSGARLTDTHNGLRAFSRRAGSKIRIRLDGMAHASELIEYVHRSGLRYREVSVRVRYTPYSLSKGQRGVGALRIVFDYFLGKYLK